MPKNPHPFRQASHFIGKAAPDGLEASGEDKSDSLHPADLLSGATNGLPNNVTETSANRNEPPSPAQNLPIVIDPFTKLGDEVAGNSPDEIALNLWRCCVLSHRFSRELKHEPPNLRKLFRGIKLSEPAKEACRFAERAFQTANTK